MHHHVEDMTVFKAAATTTVVSQQYVTQSEQPAAQNAKYNEGIAQGRATRSSDKFKQKGRAKRSIDKVERKTSIDKVERKGRATRSSEKVVQQGRATRSSDKVKRKGRAKTLSNKVELKGRAATLAHHHQNYDWPTVYIETVMNINPAAMDIHFFGLTLSLQFEQHIISAWHLY